MLPLAARGRLLEKERMLVPTTELGERKLILITVLFKPASPPLCFLQLDRLVAMGYILMPTVESF